MKVYKTLAELKSALYPRNIYYYDRGGMYAGFRSKGQIHWYAWYLPYPGSRNSGYRISGSTKGAEGAERREWRA